MNKYGLSRDIPAGIKLKIRQRDGFGCVVCGVGIIEYEHLDPEFIEAKIHDPSKMTILCPTCHSKKTRGFLSRETVKKAMLSPKCLENGFIKEVLDVSGEDFTFVFAGAKFKNCNVPLMVHRQPLFEINPPEMPNGPLRFCAKFYDSKGDCSLVIDNNEWNASTKNWDIEVSRGKIVVREGRKQNHLVLQNISPNTVEVAYIRSVVGNTRIEGDATEFKVIDLLTGITRFTMHAPSFSNCSVGMSI